MSNSEQHYAASRGCGANVSIKLPASISAVQLGQMPENKSQGRRVRIEQTANGMWEVRDQLNLRGGLFRDYRSAARFIKHEFQLLQPSLVIVNGSKKNREERP